MFMCVKARENLCVLSAQFHPVGHLPFLPGWWSLSSVGVPRPWDSSAFSQAHCSPHFLILPLEQREPSSLCLIF